MKPKTDYDYGDSSMNPWQELGLAIAAVAIVVGLAAGAVFFSKWVASFTSVDLGAWVAFLIVSGGAIFFLLHVLAWCVRAYRWTRDWWRGDLPKGDYR